MADEHQTADAAAGPEVSLRDELRSAVNQLKDGGNEDAAKISEIEDKRARDEQGRFTPTQEAAKPRETLTLKKPETPAATETPVSDLSVQSAAKAPEGLKAEEKAKFAELDPYWQGVITRREQEAHKALTRQDDERNFGRQALEITRPYMDTITREGGKPLDAYKLYLETAQIMRTGSPEQKGQALAHVARQFAVAPQHLFNALTGGNMPSVQPGQQAPFDPRFESLAQRQERIEQTLAAQEQQRQLAETNQLEGHIQEFAAEPGHEHFEAVKARMGVLLENNLATDLQDAYDQAVYSDATIRSTLIAPQVDPEQKRRQDQIAKANAARQAAGSINGGPGGAKPNGMAGDPNSSLRDEIRAQVRAANGRV